MENRIILSGEVESCTVRERSTEVQLLVEVSADASLHFLGPQTIDVVIPDYVSLPGKIARGAALRIQGMLKSDRRLWSLSEFLAHAAPDVSAQVKWNGVDPSAVALPYVYSHVVARSVVKLRCADGLNVALLEANVISEARKRPGGRFHQRIVNYPDDPIALSTEGKQKAVYGTIYVDRVMPYNARIRISDGMLHTFEEQERLSFFLSRRKVNGVVWPASFNPSEAVVPMRNLAVAVRSLVTSAERVSGPQETILQDKSLPYVPSEQLAMYDETSSNGTELELEDMMNDL